MTGLITRSHVGGNNAVHGGIIPLLYDWHFGMVVSTAGLSPSRTAYLHVDYRNITPIDKPLTTYGLRPVIERSPSVKADYRWAREQAVSD
jgi:hypothetical protein